MATPHYSPQPEKHVDHTDHRVLPSFLLYGIVFFLTMLVFPVVIALIWRIRNEFSKTDLPKWHACEHKLIAVLRSKYPWTRQTFMKMRREALCCGITMITALTTASIVLFDRVVVLSLYHNRLIFLIIGFSLLILMFPLSFFLQHFWLTAEPDEEHIQATMDLMQQIQADSSLNA